MSTPARTPDCKKKQNKTRVRPKDSVSIGRPGSHSPSPVLKESAGPFAVDGKKSLMIKKKKGQGVKAKVAEKFRSKAWKNSFRGSEKCSAQGNGFRNVAASKPL